MIDKDMLDYILQLSRRRAVERPDLKAWEHCDDIRHRNRWYWNDVERATLAEAIRKLKDEEKTT